MSAYNRLKPSLKPHPIQCTAFGIVAECLFKHEAKATLFLASEIPLEHCMFPVNLAISHKVW